MESKNSKKLTHAMISVLVVSLFVVGITFAWLVHRNAMITLAPVIHPGNIAITGPNGTAIESLDLSYTNDCISTDENGNRRVTIQRDICIKSTEEYYQLEIAYTTNMKGLEFSLYTNNDLDTPLKGKYLNLETTERAEDSTFLYNYAGNSKHEINYGEYSNVQTHAEPLYWKVTSTLSSNKSNTVTENFSGEEVTYFLTDYVLTVTWIEKNKETDMFYILAKNVDKSSQNN